MKNFLYKILFIIPFFGLTAELTAQDNVIDQVVWVVGDESILKSEIEGVRRDMLINRETFDGDPYCLIPEQIAVEKLFLHQAKLDSIEVPASSVSREVEMRLNNAVMYYGSVEKLEEYEGKPLNELREQMKERLRDMQIVQQVKSKITENVRLTPSEVRKYYTNLSQDSLPFIPTTVEVQIITRNPTIPLKEIDEVKNRLREYTDRVNKGEDFATLARLYSEDESAQRGGELGFMGRAQLVPEFANAAFALSDPKRVSNIVESEYGFHIIQLIERRGDRINVRHILLKPKVPQEEINKSVLVLDSLANDIRDKKFTFEEAALYVSADKDTRNNRGLMVNKNPYSNNSGTARFEMKELPQEIAKVVDTLKVDQMSKPFIMKDDKGKNVVALIKLRQRVEGHRANVSDDYQALKQIVENKKKEDTLKKWLENKIKTTYVEIDDNWKNCEFQYSGWIKDN
ncbi:MAG: peptidylprolyl isomerase [Dysgonomonas sp.]